jgi:methylglutaconyl-CoA hydratase
MSDYTRLTIEQTGGVARVTLNRPDVRNAFDAELITELQQAFTALGGDDGVHVVVLQGAGKSFSAGADINWMRASADLDEAANREGALRMQAMFRAIDECPAPVIGRIHGAALGGGSGLVACCDIVIAAEGTKLAFSEVRLGIIPAVISPFVLSKIGQSNARRLFITGERFDAAEARRIGLVHEVVPADELDARTTTLLKELQACGPQAMRESKALIRQVTGAGSRDAAFELTADAIARVRTSPEGQEGLKAFLEKRQASWITDSDGAGA